MRRKSCAAWADRRTPGKWSGPLRGPCGEHSPPQSKSSHRRTGAPRAELLPRRGLRCPFQGTRALLGGSSSPERGPGEKGHCLAPPSTLFPPVKLSLKGRGGPAGRRLWIGQAARDRPALSDQFSLMRHRRPSAGHHWPRPPQTGLSGSGRHGASAGDSGRRHGAPLKYRGRDPFCDPFWFRHHCHRGPPHRQKPRSGLDRSFSAQKWGFLPPGAWMDAADEAMDRDFDGSYDIWGGDIDPKAVSIARSNAEKAGVEDLVRFEVADALRFRREAPYGRLVQPPLRRTYLEKPREAEELYRGSAGPSALCPTAGPCPCSSTRSLSAPSAAPPIKGANYTTV